MTKERRAWLELLRARQDQAEHDVQSFRRGVKLREEVERALATWRVECERAGIRFDKNGKMVRKSRKR